MISIYVQKHVGSTIVPIFILFINDMDTLALHDFILMAKNFTYFPVFFLHSGFSGLYDISSFDVGDTNTISIHLTFFCV